jgi:DHA1 family tetracycline resistance protein-like MFS transporter
MVDLIGFGAVTTALPFYAKDFDVDAATLGPLVASWAAAQFVCAPLWGRLSDRVGRRPVMLITIAGTCASLPLLRLATPLWGLIATRIIAGGFAANISVASAYIADVTDEDERTRWMGVLGMSFGVGFLLGPALGGLLGVLGYAAPMLAASGLAGVNLVFAAAFLREPPAHLPTKAAGGGPATAAGEAAPTTRAEALRDPVIRRMCLANLGFSLAVTQLETIFAFFMMDRFEFDLLQVAGILVVMAIVMGAIQGGGMRALAARFPERALIRVGSLIMAVSFVAVPYAPSVALLMVPLLVSAVGRAILQAPLMSLVSMQTTQGNRGVVMGAFQSAAAFARIGGPIAAGWLYMSSQSNPFMLAAVILVGVAVLARALPGRAPVPPDQASEPSAASS